MDTKYTGKMVLSLQILMLPGVYSEVNAITDISTCKTMSKEDAVTAGLYEVIGKEVDDAYIAEVEKQVINQASIDEMASKLKIVYTPLHGTGNLPVRRVLDDLGFKNVYVVPEQELPDGDFPTVSYPNPEAKEAFALGLALAKEKMLILFLLLTLMLTV